MMKEYDCIIIGGGPSGMAAALSLPASFQILLLEAGPELGRKLAATGNGRCNFSNRVMAPDFYNGSDPLFPQTILAQYDPPHILDFMHRLGLRERLEEDRYYPYSMTARSVQRSLAEAVRGRYSIETLCLSKVEQLNPSAGSEEKEAKGWQVRTASGSVYGSACVILAAGGRSSPALGSDGSGFILASRLGIPLVTPQPALVQLLTARPPAVAAGTRVRAQAALLADGQAAPLALDSGEILLTDYGLSGIPILNLSGTALQILAGGKKAFLALDLVPELSKEDLAAYFQTYFSAFPERSADCWATGLLPDRLANCILSEIMGIKYVAKSAKQKQSKRKQQRRRAEVLQPFAGLSLQQIGEKYLSELVASIKHWRHEITGSKGYDHAQVTRGGLSTAAFDECTLSCKKFPGLFACGEILDVDGQCGGYNLHWAWASGLAAAKGVSSFHENHR